VATRAAPRTSRRVDRGGRRLAQRRPRVCPVPAVAVGPDRSAWTRRSRGRVPSRSRSPSARQDDRVARAPSSLFAAALAPATGRSRFVDDRVVPDVGTTVVARAPSRVAVLGHHRDRTTLVAERWSRIRVRCRRTRRTRRTDCTGNVGPSRRHRWRSVAALERAVGRLGRVPRFP